MDLIWDVPRDRPFVTERHRWLAIKRESGPFYGDEPKEWERLERQLVKILEDLTDEIKLATVYKPGETWKGKKLIVVGSLTERRTLK